MLSNSFAKFENGYSRKYRASEERTLFKIDPTTTNTFANLEIFSFKQENPHVSLRGGTTKQSLSGIKLCKQSSTLPIKPGLGSNREVI